MAVSHSFSRLETSKPPMSRSARSNLSLTVSRTGFGQHGDYVFGWQGDSLQTAMDGGCYLRNCTQLTSHAPKVKNQCNVPVTVDEDADGCEFRPPSSCELDLADRLTGMSNLPGNPL
jgi:hypothetical protein